MKNISILTLLLGLGLLFVVTQPLAAQGTPPEPEFLDSVVLELWPDFDRPALLVLETVVLPQGTTLPAVVRLPLPVGAEVNAVAYEEAGQQLISIPDYEVNQGEILIPTPNLTVRLEYYLPLTAGEAGGDSRAGNYSWTAPYDVGRLDATVQEPIFSSDFTITPTIEELIVTDNGLRYHQLPARTVAKGESLVITFGYNLPGGQLTAAPAPAASATNTGPTAVPVESGFWANLQANQLWVWLGAGLLVVAAVFLFLGWRDRAGAGERARKPQRQRQQPKQQRGKFCPQCGAALDPSDRFCRGCGRSLE